MGILWHRWGKTCHGVLCSVLERQCLAQGIDISKIFLGSFRRKNDRIGIIKSGIHIALYQRNRENVEYRRIGQNKPFFPKHSVLVANLDLSDTKESNGRNHLGIIIPKSIGEGRRSVGHIKLVRTDIPPEGHPVDLVCLLMMTVVRQLVVYEEQDENTDGNTDGKTRDVDECVSLMFPDDTQGNQKIVFQHRKTPVNRIHKQDRDGIDEMTPIPNEGSQAAPVPDDLMEPLVHIAGNRPFLIRRGNPVEEPFSKPWRFHVAGHNTVPQYFRSVGTPCQRDFWNSRTSCSA